MDLCGQIYAPVSLLLAKEPPVLGGPQSQCRQSEKGGLSLPQGSELENICLPAHSLATILTELYCLFLW